MRFGEKVRALRTAKKLGQRGLARLVGVSCAYISKVETGRLEFGDYPSESLVRKLAVALGGDEDELLLMADKIPEAIRRRLFERPDAFREIALLDDERLDRLLAVIRTDSRRTSGAKPRAKA